MGTGFEYTVNGVFFIWAFLKLSAAVFFLPQFLPYNFLRCCCDALFPSIPCIISKAAREKSQKNRKNFLFLLSESESGVCRRLGARFLRTRGKGGKGYNPSSSSSFLSSQDEKHNSPFFFSCTQFRGENKERGNGVEWVCGPVWARPAGSRPSSSGKEIRQFWTLAK